MFAKVFTSRETSRPLVHSIANIDKWRDLGLPGEGIDVERRLRQKRSFWTSSKRTSLLASPIPSQTHAGPSGQGCRAAASHSDAKRP